MFVKTTVGNNLTQWRTEVDTLFSVFQSQDNWPWKILKSCPNERRLRVRCKPRLHVQVLKNVQDLKQSIYNYKLTICVPYNCLSRAKQGIKLFHGIARCVDVNAVIISFDPTSTPHFQLYGKRLNAVGIHYFAGACVAVLDSQSPAFNQPFGYWPSPEFLMCDALCAVLHHELPDGHIHFEYETTRLKLVSASRHYDGRSFDRRRVLKKNEYAPYTYLSSEYKEKAARERQQNFF